MRVEDLPADQHRLYEDVMAMLLGALTLNLISALNHKPGRYTGVS